MITIVAQAIVVLVMVAITFRLVEEHVDLNLPRFKTLPCYLALFAFAEIFEFYMALDALRMRNVIQLIGILLFHSALIVFAALQVHQTNKALVQQEDCDSSTSYVECGGSGTLWVAVQPYLLVAPSVIGASWITLFFWVRKLYYEFGWAIFHVVGANPRMKTMYQWYQIMICLLKFDFFCFTGVTMQLLIVVLSRSSAEFGITIAAIPTVLILLVICNYALKHEVKWLMTLSLIMMLAAESYFIYKLIRFYEPSSREQYLTTRATLTTFTIVAFLLLFASFAVGLRCFADFDRGLLPSKVNDVPIKPKYSTPLDSTGDMSQRQSAYGGGVKPADRMTIE